MSNGVPDWIERLGMTDHDTAWRRGTAAAVHEQEHPKRASSDEACV